MYLHHKPKLLNNQSEIIEMNFNLNDNNSKNYSNTKKKYDKFIKKQKHLKKES